MASPPRPWGVTKHDPIVQIDENLWTVDGVVPGIPGGRFPRKMMIVRLADGTLALHNCVPLDERGLADLEKIGKVSTLIVPSPFHCIDAHAVKARLGGRLLCPAKCRDAVAEIVAVDGDFSSLDDPTLRFVALDGVRTGEGVFLLETAGRVSMLGCDVVLNIPNLPGLTGLLFRVMGFTGKALCGPVWVKRAVEDRAALKAHVARLADTPKPHRFVPSHGAIVDRDPAGMLRGVAAALKLN